MQYCISISPIILSPTTLFWYGAKIDHFISRQGGIFLSFCIGHVLANLTRDNRNGLVGKLGWETRCRSGLLEWKVGCGSLLPQANCTAICGCSMCMVRPAGMIGHRQRQAARPRPLCKREEVKPHQPQLKNTVFCTRFLDRM